MLNRGFLCSIVLIGLVSLGRGESNGEETSVAETSDRPQMEEIKVEFCTKEELGLRRKFCDEITDRKFSSICEGLFGKLVKLCDENLDEVIVDTFGPLLLKDLWRQYDTIEDGFTRRNAEDTRANIENYFEGDDLYWDDENSCTDIDEILDDCREFNLEYPVIETILKYNGKKSLLSAEGEQARKAFQIREFCIVFSDYYGSESESESDDEEVSQENSASGPTTEAIDQKAPIWRQALQRFF